MKLNKTTRRRFIKILGLSSIGAMVGGILINKNNKPMHKVSWQGIALGAPSEITLYHHDKVEAQNILHNSVKKISDLENLFSLYKNNSQLSLLNKNGEIYDPDIELVNLFTLSKEYSVLTEGCFDVTVQPLWNLYNKSFLSKNSAPTKKEINNVLELINWENIKISENKINYIEKGMSSTFNGIAQGYITDKVTETLINNGINNTLVQLGEYRAIGNHPDNRKWKLLLSNPEHTAGIGEIEFENAAVATSAGLGTTFSSSGKHHHIFNPKNGLSSNKNLQVTITAKTATEADALSTSFLVMEESKSTKIAQDANIGFEIFDNNRNRRIITTI